MSHVIPFPPSAQNRTAPENTVVPTALEGTELYLLLERERDELLVLVDYLEDLRRNLRRSRDGDALTQQPTYEDGPFPQDHADDKYVNVSR